MTEIARFRVLKVFLFILVVIAGDFLIGHFLDYIYFNASSGKYYKLNYVINESNEDILIFGNSHAECHYVPSIITDTLQLSCYNAGFRNQDILFSNAIHESILKRHTPKLIIFNVDKGMFYVDKTSYANSEAKLSELLPFCKKEDSIKKKIEVRSDYEKYKLYSGIYPFNSTVINSIKYFFSKNDNFSNGYYPIFGTLAPTSPKSVTKPLNSNEKHVINKDLVVKFNNIINHFRTNNAQIIAIVSPSYRNSGKLDDVFLEIFDKQGILLLDYSIDPTFINNASLYSDEHHLNDTGAHLFSAIVAHDIKPILKNAN